MLDKQINKPHDITESSHHIFTYDNVIVVLDTPIPSKYYIGKGNVLFISGWCWNHLGDITSIQLFYDNKEVLYSEINIFREDAFNYIQRHRKEGNARAHRGFQFYISINAERLTQAEIVMVLKPQDHSPIRIQLGKVSLIDSIDLDNSLCENQALIHAIRIKQNSSDNPLIIIGLATYKPDINTFTRQISSIINQTYNNWFCIIQDDCSGKEYQEMIKGIIDRDDRFFLSINTRNFGFYRNFERILMQIPHDIPYIALCDQDDFWYPDKLERLYHGFMPETMLVFSDMRIIDSQDHIISQNVLCYRRDKMTLYTQIFNNYVTGAACMFRGVIIKDVLPFPPDIGIHYNIQNVAFHDQWIGLIALTKGQIHFIPQPLYDYYQHENNVVGFSPQIGSCGKQMIRGWNKFRYGGIREMLYDFHRWYISHGSQIKIFCIMLQLRIRITDHRTNRLLQFIASLESQFTYFIIHIFFREYNHKIINYQDILFLISFLSTRIIYYLKMSPKE